MALLAGWLADQSMPCCRPCRHARDKSPLVPTPVHSSPPACLQSHPSQSCFMSSMDTHTHASFQSTLPEAVAIVVAPRDTKQPYGVFRLTDDPARGSGLELILACEVRQRAAELTSERASERARGRHWQLQHPRAQLTRTPRRLLLFSCAIPCLSPSCMHVRVCFCSCGASTPTRPRSPSTRRPRTSSGRPRSCRSQTCGDTLHDLASVFWRFRVNSFNSA